MSTNETALYRITAVPANLPLALQEIWREEKSTSGFCPDYADLCVVNVKNNEVLFGYDPVRSVCGIYALPVAAGPEKIVDTAVPSKAYAMIRPLYIGTAAHLVGYDPISGMMDFFRIQDDYSLECIFRYQQTYGLVSSGFTTLEPYYYRDTILLLAYNSVNGTAVTYGITVPGTTSLAISPLWTKGWSPGWCRFAFFQLGDENFFLKSNPSHNNVNIDHMVDDPAAGSHPVGTKLPLPLDLSFVASLEMEHDPYFLSYQTTTGRTVLNRFYGDCRGWKEIASGTAVTGGKRLIPFTEKSGYFVMVY